MNKNRDPSLDIAKGIAIILMVVGHCYSQENIVLILIYAFHMPAFFIISGLIYGKKPKKLVGGGKKEKLFYSSNKENFNTLFSFQYSI